MLVTLGTNRQITAGSTEVFTYSPSSLQTIFIKVDDASTGTAWNHSVNVQLGSITLVNSANGFGLYNLSTMMNGYKSGALTEECAYMIQLGSHQALSNQQLYVSITNTSAGTQDGVDVSALVNGSGNMPVRVTEYSNTTFAQENCLDAIAYDASIGAVDEVTDTCEIRTPISASSPTFASGASWAMNSNGASTQYPGFYARMISNPVPMNTSFNYTSSTVDRIICTSAMGSTYQDRSQARRTASIQRSAVGK
jgi:hypothetical protein